MLDTMEPPPTPDRRLELRVLELERRLELQEQEAKRLKHSLWCALQLLSNLGVKEAAGEASKIPFPLSAPESSLAEEKSDGVHFPSPWTPPSPSVTEMHQGNSLISALAPREAAGTDAVLVGGLRLPTDTATVRSGAASPTGSHVGSVLDGLLRVEGVQEGRATRGASHERKDSDVPPDCQHCPSQPLSLSVQETRMETQAGKTRPLRILYDFLMGKYTRTVDWADSTYFSVNARSQTGGSLCLSLLSPFDINTRSSLALLAEANKGDRRLQKRRAALLLFREMIGFAVEGRRLPGFQCTLKFSENNLTDGDWIGSGVFLGIVRKRNKHQNDYVFDQTHEKVFEAQMEAMVHLFGEEGALISGEELCLLYAELKSQLQIRQQVEVEELRSCDLSGVQIRVARGVFFGPGERTCLADFDLQTPTSSSSSSFSSSQRGPPDFASRVRKYLEVYGKSIKP
uniref:Uncharacterized protein n=1 Tax=Chromera velia CCMP2878 TaxID=1169474 RepID=A0A0G4HH06_9ALVE|eukprot:Cvel_27499.t1-p1 / transcript=Cvel_27499.t1 / gene=Cvel_27499 / organism=Chromera_velia_CCMP2878 / gene_product=hypothetical protein / transcript_product=hypothetical protein / location=Cvel_scaffold3440:9690-11057(-) / protein_length=456 / sequence_SO=supercontig / SO=protein_coding / is_pseudo=false